MSELDAHEVYQRARILSARARAEERITRQAWRLATGQDPAAPTPWIGDREHAILQVLREREAWGMAAVFALVWLLQR